MLQTMSKPIQNGDFSRAVEKNRSAIAWWYCSCTSPAPSCGWGLQETPARLRRSGSFPARSGWVESRKMRYAAWYAAWTRSIDDMIYHWYIIDIIDICFFAVFAHQQDTQNSTPALRLGSFAGGSFIQLQSKMLKVDVNTPSCGFLRCMKWFSWNIMNGGWFSNRESRLTKLSVCISIYAYNMPYIEIHHRNDG